MDGEETDDTGYRVIAVLPLDLTQTWQWLTCYQSECSWLPAGVTLHFPDRDDPGRGSVVQVQKHDRMVPMTITYWEPPKAMALTRHWWFVMLVYQLNLQARDEETELQLQVHTTATGPLLAALLKPLLWLEKRRLLKWTAGLPDLARQGWTEALNTQSENREVV